MDNYFMPIKNPKISSLENYFKTSRILEVPDYQREFTWGIGDDEDKNQVVQLLNDLSLFVNSDSEEYLLGLITLADTEKQINGLNVKHLVDGQQRTVTLAIFLMCAYEFLHITQKSQLNVKDADYYSRLTDLFATKDDQKNLTGEKIRFSQEDSNLVMQKILTWAHSTIEDKETKDNLLRRDEQSENYTETVENLLNTREYFSEQLRTGNWFNVDLKVALEKLLNQVKFLELEISDASEALGIYDRMNNRGVSLSSADLIKNQLFVNVSNSKYAEISTTWHEMSLKLGKHVPKRFQDPEFLVRAHAALTWGKLFRDTELAKTYQKYFSNLSELPDDIKLPDEIKRLSPLDFVNTLNNHAESTVSMCSEDKSIPLVYAARTLGAVQHFPLLLAADSIKDESLRNLFLNQVGSRALLQVFSKEHPPHVESIYPAWANVIHRNRSKITLEFLNETYEKYAFSRSDADDATEKEIQAYKSERFNALAEQITDWRYDSSSKRKIKATLAIISWWLDEKAGVDVGYKICDYLKMRTPQTKKKWEIDHIFANEYKEISISESMRQGIGNLVLLEEKKNKAAGAKSPLDKASEFYANKSAITFTKITDNRVAHHYIKSLKPILKRLNWEDIKWDITKWGDESITLRKDFIVESMNLILDPVKVI